MDMTKFEDLEDPGFVAVAGELRRWIKELVGAGGASLSQSVIASSQENTAAITFAPLREDFKKQRRATIDSKSELGLEEKGGDRSPVHTLPIESIYCYGRGTELKTVAEHLESTEQKDGLRIFTLWGIGGIGKSHLAQQYAYKSIRERNATDRPYDYVFWIRSENLAAIQDSFSQISDVLGLSRSSNIDEVMTKIKMWLWKSKISFTLI